MMTASAAAYRATCGYNYTTMSSYMYTCIQIVGCHRTTTSKTMNDNSSLQTTRTPTN